MVSFSRKHVAKLARRGLLAGIFLVMGLPEVPAILAQAAAPQASSRLILRSTTENLVRGFIPAGIAPALRIQSGQTVQIETFSHHGFVDDPVAFFKSYGISAEMVLPDLIAASKKLPRRKTAAPMCSPVQSISKAPSRATRSRCESLTSSRAFLTAVTVADRGGVLCRIF
jgi:hypothetical protein